MHKKAVPFVCKGNRFSLIKDLHKLIAGNRFILISPIHNILIFITHLSIEYAETYGSSFSSAVDGSM